MSSDDLDSVASAEMGGIQRRVQEFQRQAQRQQMMQHDISSINGTCFQMCVPSTPTLSLSKAERKCISQCAARIYDTRNLVANHFMQTQEKQQQQ